MSILQSLKTIHHWNNVIITGIGSISSVLLHVWYSCLRCHSYSLCIFTYLVFTCVWHACVYICVHMFGLIYNYMNVYVCMNMCGGWRSVLGVFHICSPPYILRQGLSAELGLDVLASQASQLALGIPCPCLLWAEITGGHTYLDFTWYWESRLQWSHWPETRSIGWAFSSPLKWHSLFASSFGRRASSLYLWLPHYKTKL